jgi:hypothetical protein
MSDIAKCNDVHCPSKLICHRYTAPAGVWQTYGHFGRETDAYNCDMFWDNETCKYCGLQNGNHKVDCETQKITLHL